MTAAGFKAYGESDHHSPTLMRPDVDFPESDCLLENASYAQGSDQVPDPAVQEAAFLDGPQVDTDKDASSPSQPRACGEALDAAKVEWTGDASEVLVEKEEILPASLDPDEQPLKLPLCGPQGGSTRCPAVRSVWHTVYAPISPTSLLHCLRGCERAASEADAGALQSVDAEKAQPHEEVPVSGPLSNTVQPHTPRQLAAWKENAKQEGAAKVREFQISISKKGQKLGIRYDDSDGMALVIKIINPGVFYDSIMEQKSDQWVMPDDRIVEVNGVRGKSELLEEQCMKADVLSMKVERLLPAPGVRVFCKSQDPTVKVHAYDLFGHGKGPLACVARTLNGMSTRYGLFHTGVEVFGCEWFFGASVEGLFHGVNCNESKQHPQHRYRTSVVLGATSMSPDDFEGLMPLLRMKWPAWSYHAMYRNCHSFTDFFCKILGFRAVPRFGLFGSGDVLPGEAIAEARSLMPGCGCSSLKAGEGRGAVTPSDGNVAPTSSVPAQL